MHWKGLFLAITTMLASVPAVAAPPDQSPRPVPRPVMETPGNALAATVPVPRPDLAAASTSGLRHSTGPRVTALVPTRPQPRPAAVAQRPVALSAPHVGIGQSLRPRARSDAEVTLAAASLAPVQPGKVKPSKKGAVCGDPAIKGQTIAPITSRVKGCGVADPVRITEVSGVRLSQAAIMDCTTAKALKGWIDKGMRPAFGRSGGGVVELKIAAHYACRTRNSKKGAKISEHGKGHAIDISGFTLANGKVLTVKDDYRGGRTGRMLRSAHVSACGIFGTTLGPSSDGHHEDHFHFDTARYRGGPFCR